MKRFWDEASVTREQAGWAVQLDGRPVRIPGGGFLLLGTLALAEAVAAEWQAAGGAKGGELSYADLPLTRLAGTAQERIAPDPRPVVRELARYGESDLLCYRAESPDELVRRQHELWQPWVDWSAEALGAPLTVTAGIVHRPQPPQSLAALEAALVLHPPPTLAALGILVPAFGSLVLGLAVANLQIDAGAAHLVASVDEIFQAEIWGEDDEAASRRLAIAEDIAVAGRFLVLSRARGTPGATDDGTNRHPRDET